MGSLAKYTSRQALVYYALSLPAVIAEVFFSLQIASNPQGLVPQIAAQGALVTQLVQVLPWVVLLVSIYAVLQFRPSTIVTLLTISFFILTAVTGQVSYYTASLVVLAAFATLIGFNYARAAKVLAGRSLKAESEGPIGFQLASIGLDLVLPLAAALGVMTLVSAVINLIKAQVVLLPEPLGTLGGLYLRSHVNLVFTTIAVAGAAVWALRRTIEPIILRFTLTREDAVREAWTEIQDVAGKIWWEAGKRPPRGRGLLAFSTFAAALLVVYTVLTVGPDGFVKNLFAVLGLERTPSGPSGHELEGFAKEVVRRANLWTKTIDDFLRFLIKLLWGR